MKSKFVSIGLVALALNLISVPSASADAPPALAYYSFNRKIYRVRNIEEVYPYIPKSHVVTYKLMRKDQQDSTAHYFQGFYVGNPKITGETDGVDAEGSIADLTGYAYKWFNGKWVKVTIFVRMLSQDNDWKFVSFRYEGEV